MAPIPTSPPLDGTSPRPGPLPRAAGLIVELNRVTSELSTELERSGGWTSTDAHQESGRATALLAGLNAAWKRKRIPDGDALADLAERALRAFRRSLALVTADRARHAN